MAKVAVDRTALADAYLAAKAREDAAAAEVKALRDEIVAELRAGRIVQASNGKYANVSTRKFYKFDVNEALPVIRRRKLPLSEVLEVKASRLRELLGEVADTITHRVDTSIALTFGKTRKE